MIVKWMAATAIFCLVSIQGEAEAQELDLLTPCAQRSYACNLDFFSEDRPVVRESEEPSHLTDVKATATYVKEIYAATNRWADLQLLSSGTTTDCDQVFPRTITDAITFSKVAVSIPTDRKLGDQGLDEAGSALKNIYVIECQPLGARRFYEMISQEPSDQLLIYVHGTGSSFKSASRRISQLAVDLNFDGPALLFSWPTSDAINLTAYELSEAAVAPSEPFLSHVFSSVLRHIGRRVHVIAHSLGSRLTVGSLEQVVRNKAVFHRLTSLILAAPDTDEQEFRLNQSGSVRWAAGRISVYCGDDDLALQISRYKHAWIPLGLCQVPLQPIPGVERIRVVGPTGSITRHFYYADSPAVLMDLRATIAGSPRGLGRRWMRGFWLLDTRD